MSEEMNFDDLTPIEIPVSIGGDKYVLREATEDTARRYRNALLECTKLGPEGKPSSIKGMADVESLLVSFCLFHEGENPKTVSLSAIRGWSARIVKKLFEKAKEISDLDEKEDLESLTKQREEIDKKIAELEKGSAKND